MAGGVEGESTEHGEIGAEPAEPSGDDAPLQHGPGQADGEARDDDPDPDDRNEYAEGPEHAVVRLPGRSVAAGPPPRHESGRDHRRHDGRSQLAGAGPEGEARPVEGEVGDDEPVQRSGRIGGAGEGEDDAVEGEDDEKEGGNVPETLHVEGRRRPHEPVPGEAGDADDDPHHREDRKPGGYESEGVPHADEQPAPHRRPGVEPALGDVHSEGLIEELEAGRKPRTAQIGDEIRVEVPGGTGSGDGDDGLEDGPEHERIPPERRPSRAETG